MPLYNLLVVKPAIIPVGKCFAKVQSGLILFGGQKKTKITLDMSQSVC
jgi:hypothetical protein